MQQSSSFFLANWPLFLALAIILAMLARSYLSAGATRAVRPVDALQLINREDALVLDVRTDKEFQEGHILNAMHVPLGVLSNHLTKLAPYKQSPIVVVCRSGARSGQAVGVLRKASFEKVYNLSGGVMAWQSANMPLTKEKGKPPKPARPEDATPQGEDAGNGQPAALSNGVEADADFDEATTAIEQKDETAMSDATASRPEIVIYTGSMCPYCARAISLLKSKGVAYTELSVDGNAERRREMVEKAGASSVPQIFVDGKHIGDCDGIHALDARGKLDALLGLEAS